MERPHGSWENNYRIPTVSKNQHFNIPVKMWGIPLKILFFHKIPVQI
jgi:hypothetical protein